MKTSKALQIIIPLRGDSIEEQLVEDEENEHDRVTSQVMDQLQKLGELIDLCSGQNGRYFGSLLSGSMSCGLVDVDSDMKVIAKPTRRGCKRSKARGGA